MELKNLKLGDYITFKYGEAPYFYYVVGKIISLSVPKKSKRKAAKKLDFKEKLSLAGHVTILTSEGEEKKLCLAQVLNGCRNADLNDVKEWHISFRSHIDQLKSEVGRLQKVYAKAIHTPN